jgi:hypothetical protein
MRRIPRMLERTLTGHCDFLRLALLTFTCL